MDCWTFNVAPGSAHARPDNAQEIDELGLRGDGFVLTIDGKKDGPTNEWGQPDPRSYMAVDGESEKPLIDFVDRNAAAKKTFFASYWPNLLSFIAPPQPTQTLHGWRKYPNRPKARGTPFTGIDNARPETKAIADRVKAVVDSMPFDVEEYLDFELPGSDSVGDWGN